MRGLAIGVVALVAWGGFQRVAAQDSTGVNLREVPAGLPQKERDRLGKQRKLVKTAVDSVNAAINRFNVRCGNITSAGQLASCQSEMTELQGAGAELEQLKTAFNSDVERTSVAFPALPARAAPMEQVSTAEAETRAPTRRNAGKAGGGSALQQLKSAKVSGDRARPMEDGRDPAMDVFDRPGGKVNDEAPPVLAGMRKELVIPESVRKDPEFRKLLEKQNQLNLEHAALEKRLASIRDKRSKSDNPGPLMVEEAKVKQQISNNEALANDNRRKQEEMVDRSVKFGTKSGKPAPRKVP